jgi:microcystin degradation protein MlrC
VGEKQNQPFQLSFNAWLRVDFQGSRVTSDGGLILVRELDERFGLSRLTKEHLVDSRTGRTRQFPLADRAAVLDWDGIWVVLVNTRRAFTSPEQFKQVGIDPLAHKIVVVKLGSLFQALRDIAPRTIMALTPGFAYQSIEKLPYKNVRRPIYPLDPNMTWSPAGKGLPSDGSS